jgi:hypothetical protein
MKTNVSFEQLRKWHRERVPAARVCEVLGWSVQMYRSRMREALGLRGADDPDESTIKTICQAISSEWTDEERATRARRGGSAYQKLVERAAMERKRKRFRNGCADSRGRTDS